MADNNCMDPQGFNDISRLRASDADRDAAAAVINNALAEGRLTAEEHSGRLDAIYAAKTHADLATQLDDLPGQLAMTTPSAAPVGVARPRHGRIIAICAGATRKGPWHADAVIEILTVCGGVELDFRDATLPAGKEVILKATTILGGVEVIVPPEMRVVDNGIAILGGRDVTGNPGEASTPDAPVLRIEGACILGGVEVKRKSRKRKSSKDDARAVVGYVLDQVRDRRRDAHDQIRDRRRELHDEMRARRREIRRAWSADGEE
jgi:hypothetical protein